MYTAPRSVYLRLDRLEDRNNPNNTYTVTLATDSNPFGPGEGSGNSGDLRYCIAMANADQSSGTDTIQFSSSLNDATIGLKAGLLLNRPGGSISINEVVAGENVPAIDLNGGGDVTVLTIDPSTTAVIDGILIIDSVGKQQSNGNTIGGGLVNYGKLTMGACIFDANTGSSTELNSGEYFGGAIYNNGSIIMASCILQHNSAEYGGAIYNDINGSMIIKNSSIYDNTASHAVDFADFGSGGGIYNKGSLGITDSTLNNNTATGTPGSGGGIENYEGSVMVFTNCTIANNLCNGIYGQGGGIDNASVLVLDDSTLSGNSVLSGAASYGGGIVNEATGNLTINNTIIANSTYGGDLYAIAGGQISGSNDLIDDYTATGLSPPLANSLLDTNAGLDPNGLQSNGGDTNTIALLSTSPAINAGGNSLIPSGTSTDQRGDPRIVGGTVDIGAYESSVTSPPPASPPPASPPPASPPATAGSQPILVGGNPDGTADVYTESNGTYSLAETLQPFGNIPTDVRTAVADVNGDGIPDYIFATGPGTEFEITVISGAAGNPVLVPSFDPFPPPAGVAPFNAGGFVSAGSFLQNGRAQIVVTPDQAGGPRVTIYELNPANISQNAATGGLTVLDNYFVNINPDFRGGLRTAVGDLNGDGVPDLVVAAGFGGGPVVEVMNGTRALVTNGQTQSDYLIGNFFAFSSSLRDGAYLAVGDVLGNGQQDLILGPGAGGPTEVEVLSGSQLVNNGAVNAIANSVANFVPTGLGPDGSGTRVAVAASGTGDQVNVVVGAGRNMPGVVKVYPGAGFTSGSTSEPTGGQLINPFGGGTLTDGIFVG